MLQVSTSYVKASFNQGKKLQFFSRNILSNKRFGLFEKYFVINNVLKQKKQRLNDVNISVKLLINHCKMPRQGAEIQGLVDKWIKKTADKSNVLQQYESVRCRKNVVDLWEKLILGLEIEEKVEEYAIRIAEKVSEKDVKLTYNLILKLLTLCLILAEKVSDDSHHTLGDFSLLSGFRIKELASLEVSILFLLEFKIVLAMDSTH